MKKKIFEEIEIPEGIETEIDGNVLKLKGPAGENKREFHVGKLSFEKKENRIIVGHEKATKKEKKKINTITAHLKNMLRGVQKKFEYDLKICSSHFPISIEKKDNEILIKNFLGEKIPRKIKIPENVEVEIKKDEINVSSCNKEKAGQTAADFENVTRIKDKDRRIFQDGIFIIKKDGKEI